MESLLSPPPLPPPRYSVVLDIGLVSMRISVMSECVLVLLRMDRYLDKCFSTSVTVADIQYCTDLYNLVTRWIYSKIPKF